MGESFVTSRDVARLLEILQSAEAADDQEVFYSAVLAGIAQLVPCDDITFQLMDIAERSATGVTVLGDGAIIPLEDDVTDDDWDRFWKAYFAPGGCSYEQLHAGPPDYSLVVRRSDRWGDREYGRFLMGQLDRERGVRHEIVAAMQPFGTLDRRLLLFREDGPDFTDREVDIIRLVRPHLAELHLRREQELAHAPQLTPRQWEILRRVSLGSSNKQVAKALAISEGTVRKHLENAFFRIGATSRTDAVVKVSGWL